MSNEKIVVTDKGGSIGFFGLLTLIFITLKLMGYITWAWVWVLSPLWLPIALFFVGIVVVVLLSAVFGK